MISQDNRQDDEKLRVWVNRFEQWGICDLVPIAVDILRPFGFLGAQALHLLAPVLTTFSSSTQIDQLADLLESPDALDRLANKFSKPDPD